MINGDAHLQMEIVDDAIESQKNNLSDAQINLLSSAWNRIQQG